MRPFHGRTEPLVVKNWGSPAAARPRAAFRIRELVPPRGELQTVGAQTHAAPQMGGQRVDEGGLGQGEEAATVPCQPAGAWSWAACNVAITFSPRP